MNVRSIRYDTARKCLNGLITYIAHRWRWYVAQNKLFHKDLVIIIAVAYTRAPFQNMGHLLGYNYPLLTHLRYVSFALNHRYVMLEMAAELRREANG